MAELLKDPEEQAFAKAVGEGRDAGIDLGDKPIARPEPAKEPEPKAAGDDGAPEPEAKGGEVAVDKPEPKAETRAEPFEGFNDLPESVRKHYQDAQAKFEKAEQLRIAADERAAAAELSNRKLNGRIGQLNSDLNRPKPKAATPEKPTPKQEPAKSAKWDAYRAEFPVEAEALEERFAQLQARNEELAEIGELTKQQLEEEREARGKMERVVEHQTQQALLMRPKKDGGLGFPNFREILGSNEFKVWMEAQEEDDYAEYKSNLDSLSAHKYAKVFRRFATDQALAEKVVPIQGDQKKPAARKPEPDPNPSTVKQSTGPTAKIADPEERAFAETVREAQRAGVKF